MSALAEVCPHCRSNALAIPYYARTGNRVMRVVDGGAHEGELVCDACGGPRGREDAPGAPQADPRTALHEALRGVAMARARAGGLRAFGFTSVGLGVLFGAAVFATGLGAFALLAALIVGGTGLGVGAGSMISASKGHRLATERLQQAFEAALLEAAAARGGRLTATEAARILGVGVDDADRALTAMSDGSRVDMEIDDDGISQFDFQELRLSLASEPVRAPALEPVRVATPEAAPLEAEAEAQVETGESGARPTSAQRGGPSTSGGVS